MKNTLLTDDKILNTIQLSAEESAAFSATSEWGYEQLKSSVESRGDTFDRSSELVFEENDAEVLRIPVCKMPATIGNGGKVDYILNRIGVSRLHCHVEHVGSLVRIHDDSSTNGVLLNRKRVAVEDLCEGDELQIGTAVLRVRKV